MTSAVAAAGCRGNRLGRRRVARNANATGLPTGTVRGSVTGSSLVADALGPEARDRIQRETMCHPRAVQQQREVIDPGRGSRAMVL